METIKVDDLKLLVAYIRGRFFKEFNSPLITPISTLIFIMLEVIITGLEKGLSKPEIKTMIDECWDRK